MASGTNARDGHTIAAAAFRVVTTGAGAGATPAAVAAEAGVALADVGLADADDVLLAALEWSHRRIARRFFDLTSGLLGLTALRAAAADLLPLDDERARETALELTMWGRSLVSPKVGAFDRHERADLTVVVRGILQDARDNDELVPGVDVVATAARLLALIDGLSAHVLLYPQTMSRATAERTIGAEIDRLARAD